MQSMACIDGDARRLVRIPIFARRRVEDAAIVSNKPGSSPTASFNSTWVFSGDLIGDYNSLSVDQETEVMILDQKINFLHRKS